MTRAVPGIHPVLALLRADGDILEIRVAGGREDRPALDEIRDLAVARGIDVNTRDRNELDSLATGVAHQGVVALAHEFPYLELDDLVAAIPDGESALLVALDGITDPHNLGAIARTIEAVGGHGLIVPSRRAAGVTPAGEKAAAGALAHLPVVQVTNLTRALKSLGEHDIWTVGLDARGDVPINACRLLSEPLALVVGSEGAGLSRLVAETCDQRVRLPVRGSITSLNAAVATGVALYTARFHRDCP